MTGSRPRWLGSVAAALATVVAGACGGDGEPPPRENAASSFETSDTLPSGLQGVPVEPVRGRTGPGGDTFFVALRGARGADHLHRAIGRATFRLGLRVRDRDLTQYPCSSCHAAEAVVVGGERDTTSVHHNVKPRHPAETGADCATCHAATDVARLRLGTGETAGISHAYRLCAQCHTPQVDSWAKGAHGKRLVAWRGRRVVMGCADCHNPHAPATEKRIPYPGPHVPRPRGGTR